jgi:DNA sulfur modification protein DndC
MIRQLIRQKALFVVNHSGGKDSQAMTIRLAKIIPHDQLIIVHAHLPEVEWEGTLEFIQKTGFGLPVIVARSVKTFFEMVEHRGMWPSPSTRQCTSDLKRGPIEREIRRYAKQHGFTTIVNCMGMRAEESSKRAKKEAFKLNEGNSVAGRTWYDWLPIHKMKVRRVFTTIRNAGQKPFWTYAEGMTRKSCCFCIMASKSDLGVAARLRPELFQRYNETERRLGHTLMMPEKGKPAKFLDEIVVPETQLSIF